MKPLVKSVATTAVVLAALAGCASRSSGGSSAAAGSGNGGASSSSSSSPSSSASSPSSSDSSAGGGSSSAPSSPGQSGGSTATDTVKYVPVQGLALEKDGVTLATEVSWGGCNDQPQLVVMSQDAAKVVVELKNLSHFHTGIMCPNFIRNGQATVKLDAPLGSRQVIDGVKNAAISVS
jgi:hypothetical protein